MSWAGYVDNLEKGKAQCKFAAILGRQDKGPWSTWAESTNKTLLSPTYDEMAYAANIVANNDQNVMGTGITMGGHKFACLIFEPDLLICQGKGDNKDFSLVIACGTSTCLIGFNPSSEIKTTYVREAVEGMKDYLKGAGY